MRSAAVVDTSSMPRPPSDSVQIAIRVPKDWLATADEIAKGISRPGFEASRTDAFRAAIARGFEVLREESLRTANFGLAPPPPPSSRPRQKSAAKKR